MPGYAIAEVDLKNIHPKYVCAKCKLIARDAVQTACGHHYCSTCIPDLSKGPMECYVCDTVLRQNEIFPADNFVRREILCLTVSCTHQNLGCPWKGELHYREIHQTSCDFTLVTCVHQDCGKQVTGAGLAAHLQLECLYREELCASCNEPIVVAHGKYHHENLCIKRCPRPEEFARINVQLCEAEERIRALEHKQESQDQTVALRSLEEKINGLESVSFDGVLTWKIENVAQKRNDARTERLVSFYSPYFYTGPRGYKMCARIFLDGFGRGRETHISLFFVLMRGNYDALLRWPFRHKVTLMLLDQDNEEHIIDAFRPDPESSSFQKPAREMNIASGCPIFCSHTELQRHAYIRDDTMFIKIIVDISD